MEKGQSGLALGVEARPAGQPRAGLPLRLGRARLDAGRSRSRPPGQGCDCPRSSARIAWGVGWRPKRPARPLPMWAWSAAVMVAATFA